jgi:N-acyl-D-amino-acid deacylase
MKQLLIIILVLLVACKPTQKEYDLIYTNGTIVDGLGNERFIGDIGIKGDKIVKVSKEKINPALAETVVDIRGKIISPGFIDSHAHIQTTIHQFPQPENFLRQGITTICASLHSGDQPYPIDNYALSLKVAPNMVEYKPSLTWNSKVVSWRFTMRWMSRM